MVSVPDYLDFEKLFVTDIAGIGNDAVFILLSLALFVWIATKMKISNKNFMTLLIVYGLIIGAFYTSILSLVLIIVAFSLAMAVRRLLQGF